MNGKQIFVKTQIYFIILIINYLNLVTKGNFKIFKNVSINLYRFKRFRWNSENWF